jgi:hypothetical protein
MIEMEGGADEMATGVALGVLLLQAPKTNNEIVAKEIAGVDFEIAIYCSWGTPTHPLFITW